MAMTKEQADALAAAMVGGGADDPGWFWKALELINRPHSATMGAVASIPELDVRDTWSNVKDAVLGRRQFSGSDALEAFGAPPAKDSWGTWGAGLAVDILNPLDPLNYIGIGGMTKSGKAAKLLRGADVASDWAAEARAGERALLKFADEPIVRGAPVLGAMQRGVDYVKDSGFGRAMGKLFGGREGAFRSAWRAAGISPEDVSTYEQAKALSEMGGNIFTRSLEDQLDVLRKQDPEKLAQAQHMFELYNRGALDRDTLFTAIDRAGLQDVARATMDVTERLKQFAKPLKGTEIGDFIEGWGEFGHFPHLMTARKPGVQGMIEGLANDEYYDYWAKVRETDPKADNFLNHALKPGVTLPTRYGQETIREGSKVVGYKRATAKELNLGTTVIDESLHITGGLKHPGMKSPFIYEENLLDTLRESVRQVADARTTDDFVQYLEKNKVAVPWDDALYTEKGVDPDRWEWIKVNHGRWKDKPLAVPKVYQDLYHAYLKNVVSPEQALASIANGPGSEILKWWKALAISSQPAYVSRNAATGIIKGYLEGLGPLSAPDQFFKYYGESLELAFNTFKKGENIEGMQELARSGVKIPWKRWAEQYLGEGWGGGSGFIGTELERAATGPIRDVSDLPIAAQAIKPGWTDASKRLRENNWYLKSFRGVNERTEMFLRYALGMKVVDDTFAAAKRAGMPVPEVVSTLDDAMKNGEADIVKRAFANAKGAIARAHFNYKDLSPYEQRLRNSIIPFYSWLRFNIPHETVNILTQPGKYMPLARTYYHAYQQKGLTPEDAPPWMRENFAIPVGSKEGKDVYLDLTNYLPTMDVVSLLGSIIGKKHLGGRDRTERVLKWGLGAVNPFISETYEQAVGKDVTTGREFGSQLPAEIGGIPVSSRTTHAAQLIPPLTAIDRLNPMNVFTKIGKATGNLAPEAEVRPRRNEPPQAERLGRYLFGLKLYGTDPDMANMSAKQRRAKYRAYMNKARNAASEGNPGEAKFYLKVAEDYL